MTTAILVAVIVLGVLVLLGLAFFVIARASGRPRRGPYEAARFLSAAERSFFGVLQHATRGEYHVFAKVRVADLLSVRKGVSEPQSHLNRIISKHVDFLLCDLEEVSPKLVIELDDSSHRGEQAQSRDAFIDDAFAKAGIPLLRVPAKASYEPAALTDLIATSIRSMPPTR